ncbi:MAG: Hsp70 family protein [Deltaproteobacteria bacterium]|jgi:molecular chaperone DnaK (HSP70)|nr:Hsp70 family protein [Deltaproteobacteria bacterium]
MAEKLYGIDLGSQETRLAVFEETGPRLVALDGQKGLPNWEMTERGQYFKNMSKMGSLTKEPGEGPRLFTINSPEVGENLTWSIFSELMKKAQATEGHEPKKVVIALPAIFSHSQRRQVLNGAKRAGLEVLRLISHSAAIALNYAYCLPEVFDWSNLSLAQERTLLVCDLGAGHLEAALLKVGPLIEVLSILGRKDFSGHYFDQLICRLIVNQFYDRGQIRPQIVPKKTKFLNYKNSQENLPPLEALGFNKAALRQLYPAAQLLKAQLNDHNSTQSLNFVDLPFKDHKFDFSLEVSYDQLKKALEGPLTELMAALNQVMKKAGLGLEQIDQALLVGGLSQMPLIREPFTKFFSSSGQKFGQKPPQSGQVEAFMGPALGAALEAALLEGQLVGPPLIEATAQGLSTFKQRHSPFEPDFGPMFTFPTLDLEAIIAPNSALPVKVIKVYPFSLLMGKTEIIPLFEGLDARYLNNDFLGSLTIEIDQLSNQAWLALEYSIDHNGLIGLSPFDRGPQGLFSLDFSNQTMASLFDHDGKIKFTKVANTNLFRQNLLQPPPGQPHSYFPKKANHGPAQAWPPEPPSPTSLDQCLEPTSSAAQPLVVNYQVRRAQAFLKSQSDPALIQKLDQALLAYQSALSVPVPIDALIEDLENQLLNLIN